MSFLITIPIKPPIKQLKIIILNHLFPPLNSSFVNFARRFPIGKPKIKNKIPKIIFIISSMLGLNYLGFYTFSKNLAFLSSPA